MEAVSESRSTSKGAAHSESWTPRLHIPALDTIRGLAAMSVVVHHVAQQALGEHIRQAPGGVLLEWLGAWGVGIFFVLSGFCIHLPHARRLRDDSSTTVDWRHFFARRAWRLLPTHYCALALSALVGTLSLTTLLTRATTNTLVAHVFMFHSLMGPGTFYSINGVYWSIGVEVHFYLLYPTYLWLRARIASPLVPFFLFFVGLASYGASRTLLPEGDYRFIGTHWFLVSWWQWGLGVWLADVYVSGRSKVAALFRFRGALAVFVLGSTLLAWTDVTVAGLHIRYWIHPFLNFGLLGAACVREFRPLSLSLLRRLGTASYSIYLVHPVGMALAVWLWRTQGIGDKWLQVLVSMTCSMAVSLTFFALVERHFLRPPKGLAHPRVAPVDAA